MARAHYAWHACTATAVCTSAAQSWFDLSSVRACLCTHPRWYAPTHIGDSTETLESALPNATPLALDLIRRLLMFNPSERITADDAVQHPYVVAYHDASASQPLADGTAMLSEWLTITVRVWPLPDAPAPASALTLPSFRSHQGVSMLPKEQLQNLIFQEMLQYHPEVINLQWGAAP